MIGCGFMPLPLVYIVGSLRNGLLFAYSAGSCPNRLPLGGGFPNRLPLSGVAVGPPNKLPLGPYVLLLLNRLPLGYWLDSLLNRPPLTGYEIVF